MKTFDELAKLNDALIRARAARAANDCAATREVYAKAKQAYDRATATIGPELDLAQRSALPCNAIWRAAQSAACRRVKMTNRDLQAALAAFNEADEAWHKTLVDAYGVEGARERRYDADKSAHPKACRGAYATFRKTNAAYIAAIKDVG